MDLQDTSEFPRTPVGAPVGRRLARPLQDPGFHRRRQHGRRLAAIPCAQTVQAILEKASSPAIDVIAIARDRRFDRRVGGAIRQHQNHPSATRVLRANLSTAQTGLERRAFIMSKNQRHMARQRTSTESRCTVH